MAGGAVNVYIFVCIVCFLIGSSLCYIEYTLENGKVCSQIRKRELKLGERENSGISLKELRYFDNWSGAYPFNCTFTVTASWGYGIIAVIQNVVLRENETTKECVDYVQFQKRKQTSFIFASEHVRSKKFCGRVNSFHDPDVPIEGEEYFMYAQNAFVDEKGHLDVTISVAGQRLLPSESLDISIIFTAYKNCKNGDQDGFKECRKGDGMCIWEGFFDDKQVNCPFVDCFDEGGCPISFSGGKKQSSGLGTKVTIGAVVLILVLLLLFLLCLFVCRRCQVLCWAGPSAARQQRPVQQSTRVEMTVPSGTVGGSTNEPSQPSAPPLLAVTTTSSSVHEDKDLPPPYESLFPSR